VGFETFLQASHDFHPPNAAHPASEGLALREPVEWQGKQQSEYANTSDIVGMPVMVLVTSISYFTQRTSRRHRQVSVKDCSELPTINSVE